MNDGFIVAIITELPIMSDEEIGDLTVDVRLCTVGDRDRGSFTTSNNAALADFFK